MNFLLNFANAQHIIKIFVESFCNIADNNKWDAPTGHKIWSSVEQQAYFTRQIMPEIPEIDK